MRKTPFILGPLLILAGGWVLLMVLGFATMLDPSHEGWAWWRAYLHGVLLQDPASLLLGLGLISRGGERGTTAGPRQPLIATDPGRPGLTSA